MKKPKGFWLLTACLFGVFFIFGLAINLWPTDKKDVEKEEYILFSTTVVSSETEDTKSPYTMSSTTKNSDNKEQPQPSRNSIDNATWNEANLDSITKLEAIGTQFIVSLMDPDVKKDSSIKAIVNDSVHKKLVDGKYPLFQCHKHLYSE